MTKTLENIVTTALVAGIGILGFNSAKADNSRLNQNYSNPSVPTYVDGKVYSGNSIATPPVAGAIVDVTCNGYTVRDTADANGFYEILLPGGVGNIGDTVRSCVQDICNTATITNYFPNPLYIVGLDIFNASAPTPTGRCTCRRRR